MQKSLNTFLIIASFFLPTILTEKCIATIKDQEIEIICSEITKEDYRDWILKVGPELRKIVDPWNTDLYSKSKKVLLTIKNSNIGNIDGWVTGPLKSTNLGAFIFKLAITNSSIESVKMFSLIGVSLIKTLDLSNNNISNYYFLRGMSNIEYLILKHNNLNDNVDLIESLYLEFNENRKLIDLSYSNLSNFNWNAKIKAKNLTINLSHIDTLKFVILRRAPNLSLHVNGDVNLQNITIVDGFKELHMNDLADKFNVSVIKNLSLNNLYLRNNTINKLKKSIVNFRELLDAEYYNSKEKYLDLTNCKINFIENKYFFHYRIKSILLGDNKIKKLPKLTFADSVIGNLDISNNKLNFIDTTAFQNLEVNSLNLSKNELNSLEGIFLNLDRIEELDLSFNPLTVLNEQTFINCTGLTKLYLTNCPLLNYDLPLNDLIKLEYLEVSFLKNVESHHVKTLVIRDSNITEIINDNLKNLNNLQQIKIFNTTLISYDFLKLIPSLIEIDFSIPRFVNDQPIFKDLNSLRFLDISQYSIAILTDNLFENLNNLTYLNASNNLIVSIGENTFKNQKELEILSLAFNKISSLSSGLFNSFGKLTTLHLHNNQLETLTDNLLLPLKNLNYLDVSFNNLKSFTTSLPTLNHLYLQSNELDFDKLGNLSVNSLRKIDISFNKGSCADLLKLIEKCKANIVEYMPVKFVSFYEANINGIGCTGPVPSSSRVT
ncbi:unnamed protein product [Ceutorhynchus assimilis]|uniref:Uncharacterized protein n=1 Tax=Ceutorhynchus assimilis TaxID=467358 RepID=A0A9N9MPN2_9CUCU|nr:unnamed protein product [Ceutorhynchus assimilis]